MKSNFVFDTNALISAVLSPQSTNAQALRKARKMGIVVYSDETWEELSEVLFRAKFDRYFTTADRQEILKRLQTNCL
jgi:predicted nucleic acid-binding protein